MSPPPLLWVGCNSLLPRLLLPHHRRVTLQHMFKLLAEVSVDVKDLTIGDTALEQQLAAAASEQAEVPDNVTKSLFVYHLESLALR
ncbi:hypothetical protein E2C01_020247 [Portunus trituberculatus]|uniref:Uncharacterized protein n=1 Tax=Portunus trituberculatus TaxID=210409 RepID=A0A5B7DZM3_PORTR|nr:hypothetical protein [Portunus trituberculatus]